MSANRCSVHDRLDPSSPSGKRRTSREEVFPVQEEESADLELDIGVEWSPKQFRGITFRAPRSAGEPPPVEIVAFLGQYGGGKTFGAAGRFLSVCLENPFIEGVHSEGAPPMSAIVAPTLSDLMEGAYVQLKSICPPELIVRERLYGVHWDIDLINGHRILLYSAKGSINGPTLVQLWADEVQHNSYRGHGIWHNLQARARDPRIDSGGGRFSVIASGLAQTGHVEDLFRDPRGNNRLTLILTLEDNTTIPSSVAEQLKESLAASDLATDEAGWSIKQGILYPTFFEATNVAPIADLDLSTRHNIPTSIAIDPGNKAAVVFLQSYPIEVERDGRIERELGVLVVDQFLPDDMRVEVIAKKIKNEFPWAIVPGRSFIAIDPTADMDQINQLRKVFPGVRIKQAIKGPYHAVSTGERAVSRAVCDGLGNSRLFFHPSLKGTRRGVFEMLRTFDGKRDDWLEHIADALRYGVQFMCPLPDFLYRGTIDPDANMREATFSAA